MSTTNKKSSPARGMPQAFNPRTGIATQKPVAPPVYRPQPTPKCLQLKSATRPHSTQQVMGARKQPVAPPVYRPQPTPKVLQRKTAESKTIVRPQAGGRPQRPAAPSVYRPQAPKVLQRKSGPMTTGVIQPMIAILQDNLDDIHIWHQVYNMLKKHPDEDVQVLEHVKAVEPGDRLAIVGHGSEKKIGRWYNPNILANQLSKIKLPENLKRLEILTCRSGLGDQNSYVAELSRQLGYKYNVVGYRGDNFTTGEGKNRAEAVGSSVADYYRNLLKEGAKQGQMPPNLTSQILLGQDPLTVVGLSSNLFEGMKEIDEALPLIEEAFKKLTPEEDKEKFVEHQNKLNQALEVFDKKFKEIVEVVKSNKDQSLKPILIETVTEYLKILGESQEIGTARQPMHQGRVVFQQNTGQMVIKTHKEYQL